jgi:Fur family zinc uptake transcriptional regulator
MGDACHHADHLHAGLKDSALRRAVGLAEARCAERQERLTAPRRRVLELLLEADAPLKAYDLIATYGEPGAPAKPPTVYRALDFLERLGFAHRIESLNAYVPCRLTEAAHSAAFLICDCCGATREISGPDQGVINAAAADAGYAIARTTIEAHGRCPACREAA